ncbi:M24 family metallopeptidase [Bacillus timonensis]|nr:M24 family metallopeptidase [Bacillus timonensis]
MIDTQKKIVTLPLVEREQLTDSWLMERLETLLPSIMIDHNFDMWIVIGREYNEDPVAESLFPSSVDSSRRLTIFVFSLNHDHTVDRLVINNNPSFEPFYTRVWKPLIETQWECLLKLIQEKNPNSIAVNTSDTFAVSDGLTHSFYKELEELLGEKFSQRITSSEPLVIDWLQLRTNKEMCYYPTIAELARQIAQTALSNAVIHPGITTTKDVVDWIRQEVLNLGITTSFYPTVDIQRQGSKEDRLDSVTIEKGDIVHLDFGIHYLGLATDTQQLAYILKEGETDVPNGLKSAMKTATHFEDIVTSLFKEGVSGNEIFTESMNKALNEQINAMLYSHPIGFTCHGIGPIIGLFDQQKEIPIRGELTVKNNTCYALEFNIRQYIPEWGHEIPIYLEEPILFSNGKVSYMAKRQKKFYLIHS